ncbi:MAG: ATP-dependent Clp protease ATP-binding subunit, partial [Clostridia bacterium]|nr:ATP-dependent Clp protease ATP-binding subunit [Clostridia bacterium]
MTRLENGKKINEGVCMRCAKELGLPIENMLGDVYKKFGISPDSEDMEEMEDAINKMIEEHGGLPSENDDNEEAGAPAMDLPAFFNEGDFVGDEGGEPVEEVKRERRRKAKDDKKPENEEKKWKFLDTYCRNLTKRAADGKLDAVIGRDRELARVVQILCRRQKNNPCLIGEPGVGKTAIAEALAQKINAGDVPYKLKGKQLYLVDLTALVAGTQFRGQFESRVLGLLNDVKAAGNVILFIDEVHNIVGAGDAEGSINAANILKPALSRGEVQVIGATTLTEYRKYIEKDTALERRFQPVTVNEPSVEDTVGILRGIKHYYEEYHAINIPDEILHRAVSMSERYITDRYLPDKAIDLLDEAASHLSLSSAELNESYKLRDELLKLKNEREALEAEAPTDDEKLNQKKFEKVAKIKAEESRLSDRLHEIEPACKNITLTVDDLADVIEIWTGIPASTVSENEYVKIDTLNERLKKRIVGQDEAVDAVTRAIKRNRAGISYKRKPVSFIFAGPTGVGKTE